MIANQISKCVTKVACILMESIATAFRFSLWWKGHKLQMSVSMSDVSVKRCDINWFHLQLCSKQPAHLGHMLAVAVDVVVCLVPAVFPLAGADGRRACPVVADGRGQ